MNTSILSWGGNAALAMMLGPVFSLAAGVAEPAPVNEYPIHEDGGVVYDPQRREAEKTGQLARYANVATERRELKLGPCRLTCDVPRKAAAYDVIPIPYELTWDAGTDTPKPTFPVAVEATALEDESRRRGRDLFDLALPGRIDLKVEFLGSITAKLKSGARHNIEPDLSDEPKEFPPFERSPLATSGVVEAGDLVWFQFRYTNTGNTILDAEGLGGSLFYPQILRKNDQGEYDVVGEPYNLYFRDLEYLYPGESHDIWLHCTSNMPGFAEGAGKSGTPQGFGIAPGEYKFAFRMMYRCYKTPDVFLNIWEGPLAFIWEMPFTVETAPRQAPVREGVTTFTDGGDPDKLTRFIHTFEEFMTAFDCHQKAPEDGATSIRGTLYLQVAPWTRHAVVKLISTDPVAIASAALSIEVDADSLQIRFNAKTPQCLIKDGRREPVIFSQTMADMRANVQIGPFVERHIRDRLREMMDCGVNVVCCTSMPWLYNDMRKPPSNYQGDAWKYILDVARREGMIIEGWGAYPFDRATIRETSEWITGKPSGIADFTMGHSMISLTDPQLPVANAAAWLYQFRRWGDLYYQGEQGGVPISVEDTRGWVRQDVNVRHPLGEPTIRAFRAWVQHKYATIEAANRAWGTTFASFDEVDPEKDQVPNEFGHRWEYTNPKHPFHDWNAAVADLDAFRAELRVANYRDTLEIVRREIPEAVIALRTEGANVLVAGIDPQDPNPHYRHIYHSQRRCGVIAEILQASGLIRLHSDYTTIPYTPSELRGLIRTAVRQGIVPAYLPQFDNMRDIAINDRYGNDYQVHYNLPAPKKGYMMHVLTAVYPWFQATYEEGGVPGILWEDYQCDGFATATQKREMQFFKQKLEEALSTPEARQARSADIQTPSQDWRKGTKAKISYRLPEDGRTR